MPPRRATKRYVGGARGKKPSAMHALDFSPVDDPIDDEIISDIPRVFDKGDGPIERMGDDLTSEAGDGRNKLVERMGDDLSESGETHATLKIVSSDPLLSENTLDGFVDSFLTDLGESSSPFPLAPADFSSIPTSGNSQRTVRFADDAFEILDDGEQTAQDQINEVAEQVGATTTQSLEQIAGPLPSTTNARPVGVDSKPQQQAPEEEPAKETNETNGQADSKYLRIKHTSSPPKEPSITTQSEGAVPSGGRSDNNRDSPRRSPRQRAKKLAKGQQSNDADSKSNSSPDKSENVGVVKSRPPLLSKDQPLSQAGKLKRTRQLAKKPFMTKEYGKNENHEDQDLPVNQTPKPDPKPKPKKQKRKLQDRQTPKRSTKEALRVNGNAKKDQDCGVNGGADGDMDDVYQPPLSESDEEYRPTKSRKTRQTSRKSKNGKRPNRSNGPHESVNLPQSNNQQPCKTRGAQADRTEKTMSKQGSGENKKGKKSKEDNEPGQASDQPLPGTEFQFKKARVLRQLDGVAETPPGYEDASAQQPWAKTGTKTTPVRSSTQARDDPQANFSNPSGPTGEIIVIPSDKSGESSDDDNKSVEPPEPDLRRATIVMTDDEIPKKSPGDGDSLGGSTLINESAIKKPRLIAFNAKGPLNQGRRAQQKHDTKLLPAQPVHENVGAFKSPGSANSKHRTPYPKKLSAATEPQQPDSDPTGLLVHDDREQVSKPGNSSPDADNSDLKTNKSGTRELKPSLSETTSSAKINKLEAVKPVFGASERGSTPPAAAPVARRASSRRQSIVDEHGSPNPVDNYSGDGTTCGQGPKTTFKNRFDSQAWKDQGLREADSIKAFSCKDKQESQPFKETQRELFPKSKQPNVEEQEKVHHRAGQGEVRVSVSTAVPPRLETQELGERSTATTKPSKYFRQALNNCSTKNEKAISGLDRQMNYTYRPTPRDHPVRTAQPQEASWDQRRPRTMLPLVLEESPSSQRQVNAAADSPDGKLAACMRTITKIFTDKLRLREVGIESVAELYMENGARLVEQVDQLHSAERRELAKAGEKQCSDFVDAFGKMQHRVEEMRKKLDGDMATMAEEVEGDDLTSKRMEAIERMRGVC